jgi:hypothetical protein
LEKPDPQQDLANCQRFYQTGSLFFGSYNTAGQNISAQFVFPVQMRASPTVVLIAGSNANIGTLNVPTTPGSVLAYTAVTATGSASVNQPFNASADL